MANTIVLYGRCVGVEPGTDEAVLVVPWKEAVNFNENAAGMIHGEFESASIVIANSTVGCLPSAAVHISVDRSVLNFREFKVRFWLGDKPYARSCQDGDLEAFDFDWAAFIPCYGTLT
ncbi:MAG: hypothetical protein IH851_09900 [Armatimonadetes bacterium]|nr:hypothetical protein [Armatimonadota bacterium]